LKAVIGLNQQLRAELTGDDEAALRRLLGRLQRHGVPRPN
jgi:hypothetical protein